MALRVRWAWLRRVDHDRTWWSLPDTEERAVVAFFQAATVSMLGNGEMTLFWMDNWIQVSNISCLAPMVFAAVPKHRRCTMSLKPCKREPGCTRSSDREP